MITKHYNISAQGKLQSAARRRLLIRMGVAPFLLGIPHTGFPQAVPPPGAHCPNEPWTIENLRQHLQWAVGLELFTIPAYLTALYSIKDQASEPYKLIQSVVVEEMLHLELASNVLNAIGGYPSLTGRSAPVYPSDMPHRFPELKISLGPANIQRIGTFTQVELPGYELPNTNTCRGPAPVYKSIGAFYDAVLHGIKALGEGIFTGSAERQVTAYNRGDFAVHNIETAHAAVYTIINQGEGSKGFAEDLDGNLSHYARFNKIVKAGPTQFGGNVYPMVENPGSVKLAPEVEVLSKFSDGVYSLSLQQMEQGFNGGTQRVSEDIGGLMFQAIRPLCVYMMQQPIYPGAKQTAGPRFQYQKTSQAQLRNLWNGLAKPYRKDPALQHIAHTVGFQV